MVLEADPAVVVRVRLGARRDAHVGRRAPERGGGPRDLAEQVEGELQPTFRTAVLILVAVAVRVGHAVLVEAAARACASRRPRVAARPDRAHPRSRRPARAPRARRSAPRRAHRSTGPRAPRCRPATRPRARGPARCAAPPPTTGRAGRTGARRTARRPRCRCRSGRRGGWSRRGTVEGSRRARPRCGRRGSRAGRDRRAGPAVRGPARTGRAPRRSCGGADRCRAARASPSCPSRSRPVPAGRRCTRRAAGCRRTRPGGRGSRRCGTRRRCGSTVRRPRASSRDTIASGCSSRDRRHAGVGEVREREAQVGADVGADGVAREHPRERQSRMWLRSSASSVSTVKRRSRSASSAVVTTRSSRR